MPEKIIIGISVENKIASVADKNAVIVCGNSNYKAVFAFDSEWENYKVKTALFATENGDNGTIAVVFEGNECDIPPLTNTTIVGVGVVSGDLTQGEEVESATTAPAYIDCLLSIKDLGGITKPPAPDVYDQIIALLNKYIQQGGGGSGGTDEARVREIVAEETADLVAENKKYVDGLIAEKDTELAVINTVLEQSGLVSKYKATIEDTYSERVTADGANVLDGSLAKLEKVVGSTVACKNLFDLSKIEAMPSNRMSWISSVGENLIEITTGSLEGVSGFNGFTTSEKSLQTVCPSLRAGDTVYIDFDTTAKQGDNIEKVYVLGLGVWGKGTAKTITEESLSNPLVFYCDVTPNTATKITNFRITKGQNAPYQPYFTGLKSASFAGIESTNADGTETATLAFPKTATPLGVTIDFEAKKITNTYADYTFTGDEAWVKGTSAPSDLERWYCSIPNMAKAPVTGQNYNYGVCDRYSTVLTNAEYNAIKTRAVMFGFSNNFFQFVCEVGQTAQSVQELTRGMAVRYLLDPAYHTSTNFTAEQSASGNEYTAKKGGTEKVLDNYGKDYGADNTLSQNYIIVTGVK